MSFITHSHPVNQLPQSRDSLSKLDTKRPSKRRFASVFAIASLAFIACVFNTSCQIQTSGGNNQTANTQTANAPATTSGYIDIVGQWKGQSRGVPSTIVISNHSGETFSGTRMVGDQQIAIAGTIDASSRQILIRDAYVTKGTGNYPLGVSTGTVAPDGRSMSGEGKDKSGAFTWSYTR